MEVNDLEKERDLYEKNRELLVKHYLHEWVWVHEEQFRFFPSYGDAVEKAYSEGFDFVPIFIKQVTEEDVEDIFINFRGGIKCQIYRHL